MVILRLDAERHPGDLQLAALVGEFSLRSPDFPRWWADRSVSERTHGRKHSRHPFVGDLTIECEASAPLTTRSRRCHLFDRTRLTVRGRYRPAQQLDQRQGSACTRRSRSRRRPWRLRRRDPEAAQGEPIEAHHAFGPSTSW
ncbi:hypothetical protein [Pseudonocardia sp.]|uniref:MmyB family transcriptional regulator n=1 Tax=Pseudonocardia sp. TaxID=60912 RepID=UPI00345CC039